MTVTTYGVRILLVDDDTAVLAQLGERLKRDGFDVQMARSGQEALAGLGPFSPDLVLLDLMGPGMDGEATAKRILREIDVPIIVLSAITATRRKVELIERFADDYVTKPFDYAELRARITRVVQRGRERVRVPELRLGPDLSLVLQRHEAWVAGRRLPLSPIEVRLLTALGAEPGRIVRTEHLVARGWGDVTAHETFLWVAVRRLRQKIEADPDHPVYLVTERGVGYRLKRAEAVDPAPAATPAAPGPR